MAKLKSIGNISLLVVIFLASLLSLYFLIIGGVVASAKIMPTFTVIYNIVFLIDLVVLLPLSFFKKTRSASAIALYISSYILGAFTWISGFLLTYSFWGILGIVIGVIMAGVGVVFTGFIASLLNGYWYIAVNLVVEVIVLYGARLFALHLIKKIDDDARPKPENEPLKIESES
jgi:hypothetical protein